MRVTFIGHLKWLSRALTTKKQSQPSRDGAFQLRVRKDIRAPLLRHPKVSLPYTLPQDRGHHEKRLDKALFCLALSTSTPISNPPYNGTRIYRTSNIQNLKRFPTMDSLKVCCLIAALNLEKHFPPCLTSVAHCSRLTLQFGCPEHTPMK